MVAASGNSCRRFVNWTQGGSRACASRYYRFTATASRDLEANFKKV
ncbi:MAG: hypothetical protein KKE79_04045 [Actinobacteria bacterium]|nr:hypothetical protein [Actinomycetota bacterium]